MYMLHVAPSAHPTTARQTEMWTSESDAHDSATVAAKQEHITSVNHLVEGYLNSLSLHFTWILADGLESHWWV